MSDSLSVDSSTWGNTRSSYVRVGVAYHHLRVSVTGSFPFEKVNQSSTLSSHDLGSNFCEPKYPKLISKRLISIQITVLNSKIARFFPAQFAGPNENGINAETSNITSLMSTFFSWCRGRDERWEWTRDGCVRCTLGSQRSGQNTSAKGAKFAWSRWRT